MFVGIIGGSGLYDLAGLCDLREEPAGTPFGEPSAPPVRGRLGEVELAFIPRHGKGHRLLPSEINFRANVYALRSLGADRLISVSAVGSMRQALRPGDLVIPDQFIDRTTRREATFFGGGIVGHVGFGDPVCADLASAVFRAARATGFDEGTGDRNLGPTSGGSRRIWRGGTYVCIEGPQFSTRAESLLYRSWGVDVIGMTAVTEAKLAREAGLCFTSLSLSTDYDCWHPDEAAVTATSVVEVLRQNIAGARAILQAVVPALGPRTCRCAAAAENAILTAKDAIPAEARRRVEILLGRSL